MNDKEIQELLDRLSPQQRALVEPTLRAAPAAPVTAPDESMSHLLPHQRELVQQMMQPAPPPGSVKKRKQDIVPSDVPYSEAVNSTYRGGSNLAAGTQRGVMDVAETLGSAATGTSDVVANKLAQLGVISPQSALRVSDTDKLMKDANKRRQEEYTRDYGDSTAANIGRVGGNILGSAPLMMGAQEMMAPAMARFAPAASRAMSYVPAWLQPELKGAIKGAVAAPQTALLTSAADERPLSETLPESAMYGGAFGALGPIAREFGAVLGKGLRSFTDPFTRPGMERITDRAIQDAARHGPTGLNLRQIIPGSEPTLAEATGNAGLASSQRILRDVAPGTNQFVEREANQNAARRAAYDFMAGDKVSLQMLMRDRADTAESLIGRNGTVWRNKQQVDPLPVVREINKILASPTGQRDAVVSALTGIKSKLLDKDGKIIPRVLDPEQLYGIRKAIGDSLSPLSRGTAGDARLAAAELKQIQSVLDQTIEKGAPGFRNYLDTYSTLSKPIDTQKFLQDLTIADAKGNVSLARMDRVIGQIEDQRSAPGPRAAKAIPHDMLEHLQKIREDLIRDSNRMLGKSQGSTTFQNLATNNLMSKISPALSLLGVGESNPLVAGLGAVSRYAYGSRNEPALDLLRQKFLHPELAANALQAMPPQGVANRLGAMKPLPFPFVTGAQQYFTRDGHPYTVAPSGNQSQ